MVGILVMGAVALALVIGTVVLDYAGKSAADLANLASVLLGLVTLLTGGRAAGQIIDRRRSADGTDAAADRGGPDRGGPDQDGIVRSGESPA